jgi:CO dehydrogenase nickel-insertion accessory protein CooC1
MEMEKLWFILNKIESQEIESKMMQKLGELKAKVIGVVHCDREVIKAGLEGPLVKCKVIGEVKEIVEALERMIDCRASVGEL